MLCALAIKMAAAAHIDDELYSRQVRQVAGAAPPGRRRCSCISNLALLRASLQLFVMGHAAQARMQESDVLVVGLAGVGVEIGKPAALRPVS